MPDLTRVLRGLKWLVQVLRDLKMTYPNLESLERLEKDLSKSWESWKWLIQVLRVLRGLKTICPSLERLENDLSKSWESWEAWKRLVQVLRDLKMTHQICTRNTLNEERFYVDGALVIASSLRNTEIKRILSAWSLEAFLRLLGRSSEMREKLV